MGVIGAILGDIAGMPYEFAACSADLADDTRQKGLYDLFDNDKHGSHQTYTDDTVMTIAALDCLLDNFEKWTGYTDITTYENKIVAEFAKYYRKWGEKYPFAGYGGMFSTWLHCPAMEAYNSYGNGSAMRVSPCAMFDPKTAKYSAMPTHDHPEGVKGAETIAQCIALADLMKGDPKGKQKIYDHTLEKYPSLALIKEPEREDLKAKTAMARGFRGFLASLGIGKSKPAEAVVVPKTELDEFGIEKSVTDGYYTYGVDRPVSEYHDTIRFNVTCQDSVPVAVRCFYETDSFKECMYLINSMLIDTDTVGAMAGAICESFYGNCMGSHEKDVEIIRKFLPDDMTEVLNRAKLL